MNKEEIHPKVSIIMPTWNRAALIMETIASIRDQTYNNWELIIVDDGSEDGTGAILEKLQDPKITFIPAGRIGIGGKIKNIGLQKASGELIAFIDSDDLWDPVKLEKQVHALLQYPEAGFSLTGGYNFKYKGIPVDHFYKNKEGILVGDLFLPIFKSEVAVFTQALMVRKKCIETEAPFKEAGSFSDVDFIISLALHFKAVILYEPLVYRRLHDSNYITPAWEKSYDEGIRIIHSYKNKLPSKIYHHALFRLFIDFGEKCLVHKNYFKALKLYVRAWLHQPFSIVPAKKTGKVVWYFYSRK
jgi:glycosyltransferase involved in cell wall biosynthesis